MDVIRCIDNPVVQGLIGKCGDQALLIFGNWISSIVSVLLITATVWTLFQMLMGGLRWISSGGNAERLESAQGRIRDAIIGLVILFASWALYLLILNWLGINNGSGETLQFKFPTLF